MIAVVFFILGVDIVFVHTYSVTSPKNFEVTNDSVPESRIYGGFKARYEQFPFMIFLLMFRNIGLVTVNGSLIKPYWVLTVAQNFHNAIIKPEDIILIGGKANLKEYMNMRLKMPKDESIDENLFGVQERRAAYFYVHPRYDKQTKYNDVAVIKLKIPFNSTTIKPMPISRRRMRKPTQCIIVSWGFIPNQQKRTYELYYTKKIAKTIDMGCLTKRKGHFICLYRGKRGICDGDMGSPLVCNDKIYGIASFRSYKENGNHSCGDSFEDFYTEVFRHVRWINNPSGGSRLTCTNMLFMSGFILWKFVIHL